MHLCSPRLTIIQRECCFISFLELTLNPQCSSLQSHWSHFNGELVFTLISRGLAGSQRFPYSRDWWTGVCRRDACKRFNTEGWSRWHRSSDLSPPLCPSFIPLRWQKYLRNKATFLHRHSPHPRLPTLSPPQRLHRLPFLHRFAAINRRTRRQQMPARGDRSCFLVCHYHLRSVFLAAITHASIHFWAEGVVSASNGEVWS